MGYSSNSFSKAGRIAIGIASLVVAALTPILLIVGSEYLSQTSIPGIIGFLAAILTAGSLIATRVKTLYVWGVNKGNPKLSIALLLIVFIFITAILSIILCIRRCSISGLSVYALLMLVLSIYDWVDRMRGWKGSVGNSNELDPMDDADNRARERTRNEIGPHQVQDDPKREDPQRAE